MKSLLSIIDKLSHNEIGTFRVFLSNHCRNGKNKKLELFDHLVKQMPEGLPPDSNDVSRQSMYQVKKRLKEELYAFLITQEQARISNDRSFIEMECHKKLYCFKILFDKGIHDHAQQVLNDVLNISFHHSIHGIYLEAVNLKNIYFPLAQTKVVNKIPVSHEIKKLKKNLGRNLYVNQYLAEAQNFLHESDESFRRRLTMRLADFDLAESEPVIVRLGEVNHLFAEKNFQLAASALLELLDKEADISGEANMMNLIYIELTKAYICMNELVKAQGWLHQTEPGLIKVDTFGHVLLELDFIIAIRTGATATLGAILEQSKRLRDTNESPVLKAKWSFYELMMNFQAGEFKQVIKGANANSTILVKEKSWLMNLKMLELLSIYKLKDSDWLYYKSESFRKILGGKECRQQRISQIVNLLKIHASGKRSPQSDMIEKIISIENEFPWHPLSIELVNYCTCVKKFLTFDSHASLSQTQSFAKVAG